MAITHTPNLYANHAPVMVDSKKWSDPFAIKALVTAKGGIPDKKLDTLYTDIQDIVEGDWIAALDYYNVKMAFDTEEVMFAESSTPDTVIDDDGAVTRNGNEFTIDFSAVEGYEAGLDNFYFQKDMVVTLWDDTKEEQGIITAIDKANSKFTAVTYDGADWTVGTSNLTIEASFGDADRESCSPEVGIELRKVKTRHIRFIKVKTPHKAEGGELYEFCFPDGETLMYDEDMVRVAKKHYANLNKRLLLQHEAKQNSGAYNAGKYGNLGAFENLKQNGLVYEGYIQTLAQLDTVIDYYSETLALKVKDFMWNMDNTQYKYAEQLAREVNTLNNVQITTDCSLCKVGFTVLHYRGYTIYFSKWNLTSGNSPFSKRRAKDRMPKSILMPLGKIWTVINGKKMQVPYMFVGYRNEKFMPGFTRNIFDGAYVGNGTCEYKRITKSSDVAMIIPVPEAIMIQV